MGRMMNALEKLGYKLVYKNHGSDNATKRIYRLDEIYISFNEYEVNGLQIQTVRKYSGETQIPLHYKECVACAEVINEMENGK